MKLSVKSVIFLFVMVFFGCQKDEPLENVSSVTDIDGNKYETVVIGNQVWMAENLRVTKLNDGTSIEYATDLDGEWAQYCWYDHNEEFKKPYGALYNIHAVQSGKLAPDGWRVANYDDWKQLEETLGGELIAGGKLKVRGSNIWDETNKLVEPDSEFDAYPAGQIGAVTQRKFENMGTSTTWWTSLNPDDSSVSDFSLTNTSTKLQSSGGGYALQPHFLSVRCIKD